MSKTIYIYEFKVQFLQFNIINLGKLLCHDSNKYDVSL